MESSWLSKALPRYQDSTSLSPHEMRTQKHPRWRTPSPMSASMIPAPIVSSVYLATPSPSHDRPQQPDEVVFFRRKQRQLEADLQILLDAQADGLLSGLEGGAGAGEDEALSTGSSTPTPTVQSLNSRARSSRALQKSPKLSLRDARKGLYTTMRRLALLKTQESELYAHDLEYYSSTCSEIDHWKQRREKLQEETRQLQSGEEHRKATNLRQEADQMQSTINELEAQLASLRERQRQMRREAQEIENVFDATMSSYTGSLTMLEEDITTFLDHMSLEREYDVGAAHAFWHGGKQQRTLESARTALLEQSSVLSRKQTAVERDREALDEGAVMWKDVVKDVTDFERKLREDMAGLARHEQAADDMKGILTQLDETTIRLESKYTLAQTRNWKLLVAAIGAELEAFLKGKEILEAALAVNSEENGPPSSEDHETGSNSAIFTGSRALDHDPNKDDHGETIRDLDQAFGPKRSATSVSDTDTEDDGPDPELLISHHDTDTE